MTAELLYKGRDLVAEATNGKLHITDPGMDEWTGSYEEFPKGSRVEVRINAEKPDTGWVGGTVVEVPEDNDRAIVVLCDQKWHENMEHYEGRGATVMVAFMTRGRILSILRKPQVLEPTKNVTNIDGTQSDNKSTNSSIL